MAMQMRFDVPEFNTTAATCLPVHETCKSSDIPASSHGEIGPKYECTSCVDGQGIQALSVNAKSGKCVPCHEDCSDCHYGGDSNSCTACHSGNRLTVTDSNHLAGRCAAKVCDDCVSRADHADFCTEKQVFVPLSLGDTANEDKGKCMDYDDDCSVRCVPEGTLGEVPTRRICTKFCNQKVTKRTSGGETKLVVCQVKKVVQCTSAPEPSAADAVANAESGSEAVERCGQELSAECVAVVDYSPEAATMSSTAIVDEQVLQVDFMMMNGNTTAEIRATTGCTSLGSTGKAMEVCESTLLMY